MAPEKGAIPVPVNAPNRPAKRVSLTKKLVATAILVGTLFTLSTLHSGERARGHLTSSLASSKNDWVAFLGKPKRPLSGKKAEKHFLSVPDPESIIKSSRHFTAKPHIAGSEQDLQTAKDVLEVFREHLSIATTPELPIFDAGSELSRNSTLGITSLTEPSAWIDTYYTLLTTPKDRALQILGDDGEAVWDADLTEHADETDPEAHKYATDIPTFHGYSHGGSAEGQLVYANFGRAEDYEELVKQGVDFTGKIVIVRYGALFRGLKIKFAEELGAVGVLIYSDPRDDGSVTVANGYKPYPHGPARNPTSVQRGSVFYISYYPGDPTTPGYPSYPNATRAEDTRLPSIPSLPISWANAERLLEEIGDLRTASKRSIKFLNDVKNEVKPIWNTIAVIPGHIKDEVVFFGNHRDGLSKVLGAADPTSGTVTLNEIVKGYGSLLRNGWRPLRTLVFASWDGEEYGLLGSTEYGEDFSEWISEHVVAYLNLDSAVSGSRFHASASPSLASLVQKTAKDISHPTEKGSSLWDARLDSGNLHGPVDAEVQAMYDMESTADESTGVSALGSGSDYTVFAQRIGIASSDQGFGGSLSDPVYHYHSIYDSERWQELYGDAGFHRHAAIAKYLGLFGLRLSDSFILPINTTQYAVELEGYLEKVEQLAELNKIKPDLGPLRTAIQELQVASIALDVEKVKAEKNFRRLLKKIQKGHGRFPLSRTFKRVIRWFKQKLGFKEHSCHESKKNYLMEHSKFRFGRYFGWKKEQEEKGGIPRKFIEAAKRIQRANKKLSSFEKGFISTGGLTKREWYKHLGTAPGRNLGYGATTLPGLTEAITLDKNVTQAQYEAGRLEALITSLAESLGE
ncbi:Zn-dependent exopeptidase [Sistotremastrum suecicum HHB10207 ss-3]|uniref:Zn-dependent exopeptidase n=1 Tax=Sistotremastrum suecicum HHB10207 ss-3 TaxID=1314776 RepID=A0A166HTA3_9AGAM|nr:Zn-dependent exopeptidase [Sistotremastrum suecicum HHB10207 ss-3]